MRVIATVVWCMCLAAGSAWAQEVVGYSCGGHERLALGELRLSVELDTEGKLLGPSPLPLMGTGAEWELSLGPGSGGQLVQIDYVFPGNDLAIAPELQHALFAKGMSTGRDKAFFFVTLNSGERLMAPPSPFDLQTQDRVFLAALNKATAIAFDLVRSDGSSLAHNVLYVPDDARQRAAASLAALTGQAREKMKDFRSRCGALRWEWDPL